MGYVLLAGLLCLASVGKDAHSPRRLEVPGLGGYPGDPRVWGGGDQDGGSEPEVK